MFYIQKKKFLGVTLAPENSVIFDFAVRLHESQALQAYFCVNDKLWVTLLVLCALWASVCLWWRVLSSSEGLRKFVTCSLVVRRLYYNPVFALSLLSFKITLWWVCLCECGVCMCRSTCLLCLHAKSNVTSLNWHKNVFLTLNCGCTKINNLKYHHTVS